MRRLEGLSRGKAALAVFAASAGVKLLVSVAFWLAHGFHASTMVELWFYVGVAQGKYALFPLDPTLLILRPLGVLPAGLQPAAVGLVALALSSLSTTLVFLMADQLSGRKEALAAAALHACLRRPLLWGVAFFTHDCVQLPLMLGSFLCALKGGRWWLASLLLILLGFAVGPTAGLTVVVLAGLLLHRLLSKRIKPLHLWVLFVAVAVAGAAALRLWGWDAAAHLARAVRGLDIVEQKRLGAIDLMPANPLVYWLEGLFLWPVVVLGFVRHAREKKPLAPLLLLATCCAGSLAVRGFRGMEAAVALLFPAGAQKANRAYLFAGAALALYFLTRAPWSAPVACAVFAALVAASWKRRGLLPVIACGAMLIWSVDRAVSTAGSTESEYRALVELRRLSKGEGKVLPLSWDRGYVVEAVSGCESLTSPSRPRLDAVRSVWWPEEVTRKAFAEAGAEYVLLEARDFNVLRHSPGKKRNDYDFKVQAGFWFPPSESPPRTMRVLQTTALYGMRYEPGRLKLFELVVEERDPLVRVFRLRR